MSGDVSTLPDTYFECLREMEKKMKEIQLKEKEKARKIEEMERQIAQQDEKIDQLTWSKNRLAQDCNVLKRVKQEMETVVAANDQQICSLNEFVNEIELGKTFEDTKYRKRQVARHAEEQAARFEGLEPEDIQDLCDEDLEEQLSNDYLKRMDAFDDYAKDVEEELSNQYLRRMDELDDIAKFIENEDLMEDDIEDFICDD